MGPVTGIDHGRFNVLGQVMAGAGAWMPHDENVRHHGLYVPGRVCQGFTLGRTACGCRNAESVSAHSFCGNVKRKAGPCAGLKKEGNNGLASQDRYFFNGPGGNFFKGYCCIEDKLDVGNRKVIEAENVFMGKKVLAAHAGPLFMPYPFDLTLNGIIG
jgi:hypothetical protein